MLSENEKDIIAVLKELGADSEMATGVMLMLFEDEDSKEENCQKLLGYISAKGKYVTPQDILRKTTQITTREQYYPRYLWAKCVTDSEAGLKIGEYYFVGISYDGDSSFLIQDENEEEKEYPANLFELYDATKVEYVGHEEDDGTISLSDLFELNKVYKINKVNYGELYLDGDLQGDMYDFEPVEFKPHLDNSPTPFKSDDDALSLLRGAFEFGNVAHIRNHLDGNSRYVSQDANVELVGKNAIIEHLKKVTKSQLKNNVFYDCALATVTKSAEGNHFAVGTRCMPMYLGSKCQTVVFFEVEGGIYQSIYILTEPYSFKLDEE